MVFDRTDDFGTIMVGMVLGLIIGLMFTMGISSDMGQKIKKMRQEAVSYGYGKMTIEPNTENIKFEWIVPTKKGE